MVRRYCKVPLAGAQREIATDWIAAYRGRTARHDQIADKHLYRLVVMIQRRRLHFDDAVVGSGLRASYLEHFAFDVQLVAGPHWPRPPKFVESGADHAARGLKVAFYEKTHGHRCGMPAACSQALEQRIRRDVLVQMEGLRIEFGREGLDASGVDKKPARGELLSRFKFLEILHHRRPGLVRLRC